MQLSQYYQDLTEWLGDSRHWNRIAVKHRQAESPATHPPTPLFLDNSWGLELSLGNDSSLGKTASLYLLC